MSRREVRQRALAAYYGAAVGDALGATTEFMRGTEVKSKFGLHQHIIGGGWLKLKAGNVTDDTQMSLYLGDAIIESRGLDVKTVADKFVAWMRAKPPDIGATIRRSLRMYIEDGRLVAEPDEQAAGNGAAMRNLPVVIAALSDPRRMREWTLKQAHITHNNPESDFGTLLLAELTRLAILQGQAAPLQSTMARLAAENPRFDYRKHRKGETSGYIVETVQLVLKFFFNTVDFESCMIGIVNQGGDADTNGAVGGALAGAFYGMDSIPSRWLKKLDPVVLKKIEAQTDVLLEMFPPAG